MEAEQLKQYVEKIERIQSNVNELQQDIRGVYAEAKGNGFSAKAIKEVLKLRKQDIATRQEEEFLRNEYCKMLDLI